MGAFVHPGAWAADKSASPGAELVGHYYLHGVREVGSELLLQADGRFRFSMSYGAVDQNAAGSWQVQGDRVALAADEPLEPRFSWLKGQPPLDADCQGQPERPVVLTVCIKTTSTGMVWSNVKVPALFSNGQERSGMTGRSGKLYFDDRAEPQ